MRTLEQKKNCAKLALELKDWLDQHKDPQHAPGERLNMKVFFRHEGTEETPVAAYETGHVCGTSCCVLGYAAICGIAVGSLQNAMFSFWKYATEAFGATDCVDDMYHRTAWEVMFSSLWSDDLVMAVERVAWWVEHGDEGWWIECLRFTCEGYLDKGSLENVMSGYTPDWSSIKKIAEMEVA